MSQFPPASFHPQHRLGTPEGTCGEEETDAVTRQEEQRVKEYSHISSKGAIHFFVFMALFLAVYLISL